MIPEDIPFEVICERWSSYDLGDDIILKTKMVLLKILKPANVPLQNVRDFIFQGANPHLVVCAPLDKKGTPTTQQLTPELIEESIIRDIDPRPIEVNVNEYRLENDTIIRFRVMFQRVALTNLFSADGSPVVSIRSQLVPQIILPARVRRKSESKSPVV